MKELYKKQDGQTLTVAGHLNSKEIRTYLQMGYKFKDPRLNKNGIEVK